MMPSTMSSAPPSVVTPSPRTSSSWPLDGSLVTSGACLPAGVGGGQVHLPPHGGDIYVESALFPMALGPQCKISGRGPTGGRMENRRTYCPFQSLML